jgi:hypothetical protein
LIIRIYDYGFVSYFGFRASNLKVTLIPKREEIKYNISGTYLSSSV